MQKKITNFIIALVFILAAAPAPAQLKKVRLSATSVAVTELQFRIALLKGFYRDEGLDVEIILIRGAVGMQALLGGSVDYTSAAGSIIAAATRGAPVRLVLVVNAKPQQEGPEIPVALALWASVSPEVDKRLSESLNAPIRLRPDEWKSGKTLWLVEVVGDPRVVPSLLKELNEKTFKDRQVKMRVRGEDLIPGEPEEIGRAHV